MSSTIKRFATLMLLIVIAACVTINVYFPEAAVERAADRFIQDVIGSESASDEQASTAPAPRGFAARLGDWLVPSAHAQDQARADIDIRTPQITAIKERMAQRHDQHLKAWYEAGAIGFGNDGLVDIRDRGAVGLSERRQLEEVVAAENADRRAVYREIAVANGHPEWEDQIRETFADRWVANAREGWYYRDADGTWKRK
ncbi:MAG: YdbL family protein [Wenzhouxiangellaceae bacterium]|nr:YdbL family protein [Wenzhouxiangellaceae bacterium]